MNEKIKESIKAIEMLLEKIKDDAYQTEDDVIEIMEHLKVIKEGIK